MKKFITFIVKLISIGLFYILASWLVYTFVTWSTQHRIYEISEWSELGRFLYLCAMLGTAIALIPLEQNKD